MKYLNCIIVFMLIGTSFVEAISVTNYYLEDIIGLPKGTLDSISTGVKKGIDVVTNAFSTIADSHLIGLVKCFAINVTGTVKQAIFSSNQEDKGKHICDVIPNIKSCYVEFLKSSMDKNSLDNYKNDVPEIISNIFDSACVGGGELITRFFKEGGWTCIQKVGSALNKCQNGFFNSQSWEKCQNLRNTKNCIIDLFKSCSNEPVMHIVEKLTQNIMEKSACSSGQSFYLPLITTLLMLLSLRVVQ